MNPLDVLKQAVKDRSWPMVRLAISEFERTHDVATKFDTKSMRETLDKTINNIRENLFSDDGTTAKIRANEITRQGVTVLDDEIELGSFEADKKAQGKTAERTRKPYQSKYLECSSCHKKFEVDGTTYKYHTTAPNGDEITPYVCTNCL